MKILGVAISTLFKFKSPSSISDDGVFCGVLIDDFNGDVMLAKIKFSDGTNTSLSHSSFVKKFGLETTKTEIIYKFQLKLTHKFY